MFDIDRWREIFQSISKNKLRSIMSGFTVAFAIILFTLLFGIVNGLSNSFADAFADDASNSMFIRTWKTSKPFNGYKAGRQIILKNDDIEYIKDNYKSKMDFITPRIFNSFNVSHKGNNDNYQVTGVYPSHAILEKTIMVTGRYVNELDMKDGSKNIVIGKLMKEDLFDKGDPVIGEYLNVGGIAYQVVGIFTDEGDDRESRKAYIPASTAQQVYGNTDEVGQINLGYNQDLSLDAAIAFGNQLERDLKERLDIHPDDQNALFIRNFAEANQNINSFTGVLYLIVLVIGMGTLVAGVIGISNIMIFVVKERTKELGIRKALGASPMSIKMMVIQESVLITALAGYIGLLIGEWILKSIGNSLEEYFIKDPSVSPGIVIAATIVLVIAGTIAGYMPASRAARIKPIVALNAD
ncbi:MAG: ABC transporter permease [Flavobacteriaceae bacterium]